MNYFITAIGTDSGKTLSAAIFCEALQADYWKPVQAGFPRDTDTVKNLISNMKSVFHPESYLLKTPASPHAAAKIDQTAIRLTDIQIPKTDNTIIIEGAGGCLAPLNDHDFVIDLATLFKAQIILVSNHYLGSINHTLLTLESLRKRNLTIKGIIFNGSTNQESEHIILKHARADCLLRIEKEPAINNGVIQKYAALIKEQWHE